MTTYLDLFGEESPPPMALRRGRRVFVPGSVRAWVVELRREGASLEAIGKKVGLPVTTLRTRLKAELERGLPGGRKSGRPRWAPTPDDRAEVGRLAAARVSQERIAEILGITPPTLRRHCGLELCRRQSQTDERRSPVAAP